MATRARIGIERQGGEVESIYCHWDGHPNTVGLILAGSYPSREAAEALLALGDISQLGETPETSDAYQRDWSRAWEGSRPERHADAEAYREREAATQALDFLYLFREGGWHFTGVGPGREPAFWRRLSAEGAGGEQ